MKELKCDLFSIETTFFFRLISCFSILLDFSVCFFLLNGCAHTHTHTRLLSYALISMDYSLATKKRQEEHAIFWLLVHFLVNLVPAKNSSWQTLKIPIPLPNKQKNRMQIESNGPAINQTKKEHLCQQKMKQRIVNEFCLFLFSLILFSFVCLICPSIFHWQTRWTVLNWASLSFFLCVLFILFPLHKGYTVYKYIYKYIRISAATMLCPSPDILIRRRLITRLIL